MQVGTLADGMKAIFDCMVTATDEKVETIHTLASMIRALADDLRANYRVAS